MYASHMCSRSEDILQNVLNHLLQKKNSLPSFSIGDRPLILAIGISTATSISDTAPLNDNRMTAPCRTSETTAAVVNFTTSESSETFDADINLAVSSNLPHVRNSVQTENSSIQNHAPNTDLEQSFEVAVQ